MEIKEAKEDLQKRQEGLAKELNEVITQEQAVVRHKAGLIEEITRNNGEARLLQRLSENGDKTQGK